MKKTIKIMVSYVNIDIIADIKPPYTHYCCLVAKIVIFYILIILIPYVLL